MIDYITDRIQFVTKAKNKTNNKNKTKQKQ